MTVFSRTVTATVATTPTIAKARQGAGMDSGHITRTGLPTPLGNLALFTVDTDTGLPIYDFAYGGLNPGQAEQRRQKIEAQWVVGAGYLGSTPGMAQADYVFLVTAPDGATLDTRIGALITAVYNQDVWELHVSFEGSRAWAWENWKSNEPEIGFAASFWGPGPEPAMFTTVGIVCERHPTLIAGPYQPR